MWSTSVPAHQAQKICAEKQFLKRYTDPMENTVDKEMARMRQLLESLAGAAGITLTSDSLSEPAGENLFHHIIAEYRQGRISVDDLSALCELVYGKLPPHSGLYSLLLSGADIEWDIRHTPIAAANTIAELLSRFKGHNL